MSVAPAPSAGVRPFLGPVAVRLAMGCLVIALGASQTTCRLDKLISPAIADRLAVTPPVILASANSGSTARSVTLRIKSADGATLPWTATKTAAWVTLAPISGGAPDSLVVTLDPDTLAQIVHQDVIVFTSAQTNDTVRVPVTFDILPPVAELSLSDTAHAATAFVRSAQPDTFSLRIKNTGGLPLNWTATLDTGWVTLSDSGGTVPPRDSTIVLVTLRPESLSTGTHPGTIAFAATGAIGSPDTLRIAYAIAPCVETGITLDTIKSSSIALSDCGAPQRAGSQAKLYSVQATAGDTLSFRLTASFNAYLILTNSTGASVLDENDQCGAAQIACLLNYHVTATGRHLIEVTTTNAREVGTFTLSAVKELSPTQPAPGQFRANGTTAIGVGAITPESTVVFKATVNDPNPFDSVRLEVEVTGLASGILPYASGFVPPGTSVGLPVTGLRDNEGYHWRARSCDKTGRCSAWFSFGGNPDTVADFVVNWQTENPTIGTLGQIGENGAMAVGGSTGGTRAGNVIVTFTAGVTDLDPGDMISIEVEYKKVGTAFDSTTIRGSGVPSGGTASLAVSIPVPLLLNDSYHWRARVCDQTNRCSVWVPFGGNAESATDFQVP